MREHVVIVGRRRAAVEAARRAGHAVTLVSERAVPPSWGADRVLLTADRSIEALAGELRAAAPVFVCAATEAAVVPAAELRAALGLPGLSVEAARRCTDKVEMKRAFRRAGLACADSRADTDGLDGAGLTAALGLPLVVKRRMSSGSRGTRVVHRAEEVTALVPGWMAEAWIEGVEMSVEAFVVDGAVTWWNPTEYLRPGWASLLPTLLPDEVAAAVTDALARSLAALGVTRGMAHLELFLTPGGIVIGELAARPPGGHLMTLIERAYGFDAWAAWLAAERGEQPDTASGAARVAAAWLFHPGPGRVTAVDLPASPVDGVDVRAHFRAKPGDVYGLREGTGQEAGHVLAVGPDRDAVAYAIRAAIARVRVDVSPL